MLERETRLEPIRYPASFAEWCALVCRGSVVRRGLKFAVVVGAVLITINHGDAILAGELDRASYVKMALTVVVPYVVSVLSSVGAMLHAAAGEDGAPEVSTGRGVGPHSPPAGRGLE